MRKKLHVIKLKSMTHRPWPSKTPTIPHPIRCYTEARSETSTNHTPHWFGWVSIQHIIREMAVGRNLDHQTIFSVHIWVWPRVPGCHDPANGTEYHQSPQSNQNTITNRMVWRITSHPPSATLTRQKCSQDERRPPPRCTGR